MFDWSRQGAGMLLAVLICAVLAVSGFDSTVSAQAVIDYDADDDGLIEVTTEDQLSAIRWDLDGSGVVEVATNATTYAAAFPTPATNMGCPGTACTGYELAADISLTSSTGMGWEPIGDGSTGTPPSFTATFEGNGHTISNLFINRTTDNVGLFGATGSASAIRNVKLTSVNVTTTGSNVGALVGLNDDVTNGGGPIDNCEATGTVTGRRHVGGLVGQNAGPITGSSASVAVTATRTNGSAFAGGLVGENLQTTISNSHATGDVTAFHNTVGGLAGSNYDEMAWTTTALPRNAISGSTASGTVTTTGSNVGGLVGWNSGTISESAALNPSVTGASYVGGLVGQNNDAQADGSNAISGSSASGTVTATGNNAGGLVGGNNGPISDSAALNPSVTGAAHVGGLVGQNNDAQADGSNAISGSTASGTVTGTGTVGGLVGWNNGPISDSAALNSSVTGASSVGGLVQYAGGLVGLNESTIRDSYASGAVQGSSLYVGGLVGSNGTWGQVIDSRADGAVSGPDGAGYMGGLVGHNLGSVTGSVATGAVTGTAAGTAIGGLVGRNRGPISRSAATGAVSGGQQVGGLVGYGANVASITESWASGAVTAIADASVGGSGSDVGGLVGWNDGPLGASFATGNVTGVGSAGGLLGRNTGAVVAAYATGHVTVSAHVSCPSNSCASVAGGLIGIAVKNLGFSDSTASNVQASYSTGSVSGPSTHVVGGLAGTAQREDAPYENDSAVFTNNYWDTETPGPTFGVGSDDENDNGLIDGTETLTAGVTGQTTAALKAPAGYTGIFADWNVMITGVTARTGGPWDFGGPTDYPLLRGLGAPPSFPAGTATLSVAEERAAGTPIGSPLTATATVGDALSYKLVGAGAVFFSIHPATGQLSTKTLLDYENPVDGDRDNTYELMVQASDGMTVAFWTVSVTITNVNEAPAISGPATIDVDEGHTGTLGTYGTDDPELSLTNWGFIGDNLALSGPDSGFFRFDKETGQLTFAAPPDFEGGGGQYEVTVDANDGELHGMLEVTVNVADVEEPGTLTFEQRQPVVDRSLTATLTEPDGVVGAVTWTWQRSTSASGGWTDIDGATSDRYNPGADDVSNYLRATATYEDGYGPGKTLQTVTEFTTAAANSMNAAPMLPDSVDAIELPENARPGMNAGSPVQATDSDGDPISYSLTGDSEFLIDQRTGQIKVAPDAAFDFDAGRRRYSVTVTASDGFGASDTVGVTITITSVDEPPVAADDAPLGFDEDTAATIDVLANDSDPEDAKSALTVSVVSEPARGMVVVNDADPEGPTITYTPQANYNGADSFSYRVSDPGRLTSNVATVVLTIYALNDAPEFPATTTTARSVPEYATGGALVGAPVTAVDVDGDDLTYSLAGSASFEMLDGTAQITVRDGAALDATDQPTTVTVEADDGNGATASIDVTITVTTAPVIPPNNAPTFALPAAARSVPEDATGGALVGARVTATDIDAGDILTYRLSGTDATSFVVDSNGQITVAAGVTFDIGTKPTYTVTVTATDSATPPLTATVDVTITVTTGPVIPPNNAPTFASPAAARSVPEDATGGALVGALVTATDIDAGDTLTYRLSGTDATSFVVDSNGQITVAAGVTFNMAMKPTYTVTVTAADEAGATASIAVTITVTTGPVIPPNNAPTFASLTAARSVPEDATGGALVGALVTATDIDAGDILTYRLSGADASSFVIDSNGQITVAAGVTFNMAMKPTYTVTVTAADEAGATASIDVTITVTTGPVIPPNNAPVAADDAPDSFAEDTSIEIRVLANDSDPEDAPSELLLTVVTPPRNGRATVNEPANLGENRTITYEPNDNYNGADSFSYGVTDSGGLTSNVATVELTVDPVNDQPEFLATTPARSVSEPGQYGDHVGAPVTAVDVDGDNLTYSLVGSASFEMLDGTAQITVREGAVLDATNEPTHMVTVTVADEAGATASIDVTITVTTGPVIPPNNAPTFASPAAARSVPEDATGDALVGAPVTATDSDPEDTLTYSLSGTDATSFVVDSNGQITVAAGVTFDIGTKPTYTVTVTAADEDGATASIDVTITVTDAIDNLSPPMVTGSEAVTVAENSTAVATYAAQDPDGLASTFTWSLGGTDAGAFGISNTGVLTFDPAPNFEEPADTGTANVDNIYEVTVQADDGGMTGELDVLVTVADVDEPPEIIGDASVPIAENSGTFIESYFTSDPEGSITSWETLAGPDERYFAFDNGALSFVDTPDYEARASNVYQVTVRAVDETSNVGELTVTVTITNVNEAPAISGPATIDVDEGHTGTLGTYGTDDPELSLTNWGFIGDNLALSGPDSDRFRFDKETGQLTFAAPPDFEGGGGQYEVTVGANDGELHGMLEVTVNVADVEEPGTLTFDRRRPVVGQPTTATLTEPDGVVGAVTWTWQRSTSASGGWTEIATATSRSYTPVTDDVDNYLRATATYEDGYGPGKTLQTVTDFTTAAANSMNAAPMLLDSVDAIELPENARPGMDAGSPVQATDSDGDPISYSLTGDSEFLIDQRTGQIKVAPDAAFDFDAGRRRYSVTVTASDGFGASDTVGVTITITNVDEPPVAADDAPLGFDEDTAATIDVLANDSDPEDAKSALTVSVVSEPARGMVVVNPAATPRPTITYTPQANYNGSDSFSYRVTDSDGLTSNVATVALTIYALNDAPEFPPSTAARSVPEDATGDALVGAPVTATDSDLEDTLTYSLSGADASSFVVDSNGQITVAAGVTFDIGTKPTYTVTVTATDSATPPLTASVDVTITVTTGPVIPPNNAPTFASPAAARSVPEDATGDALVGAPVTATDSDLEDTLTYSLSGADASSFVVDSNGQITVAAGVTFDIGTKPTYTVTVTATDSATPPLTASVDVTITVTTGPVIPPNNAPTFASPAAARSVPEDATGGALVGALVTATDIDAGDTLTYRLSGADATSFVVDSNGQITVAAGVTFNMAMKPTYTVTVTAADEAGATASIAVTITVTTGPVIPPAVIPPVVIPPSGGGAVGGGGGGGGGGGPSPSVIDFEWNVTRDIDELGSGHDTPSGLWSDGTTLWILENGDGADDAIYAYDLETGERAEDREFELDGANRAPRGVWSDGTTMWVSDSGRNRLFAHDLASGERAEERDIALAGRNRDARGIWSGDETMWVLDGGKDSLFAYDLASGALLAEYELASTNGDSHGIWSDRVTVWVSDHGAKRLVAYRLPARPDAPATEDAERQDLERVSDEEFKDLSKASNNSPRGIWSDGDVMYVADESDAKVYTYNMPDAIDARLASLSLSGVDIGEFSSSQTEYTGTAADGTTATTVEAAALQRRTSVAIDPPDADDGAGGHQVALEDLTEITVTVTSADGSRKKTYRVRLAQEEVAEPVASCLRGDIAVGFSLVVSAGGSIEDLVACAEGRNVTALYTLDSGAFVSYILGAPELVNRSFAGLFADGVPALTPLIARSDGPATADPDPDAVSGPLAACLQGEIAEGFNLVVYEGGSVDDLDACARGRGVSAVYTLNEGEYVSYILGAPEFVNQSFAGLFADGVPSVTPLVVKRDGP